jgi:hypothetical protein
MVPGIGLGQLLRAEHLHGVPETYDLRWIIRHVHYHPRVDVMHNNRIFITAAPGPVIASFTCTPAGHGLSLPRLSESAVPRGLFAREFVLADDGEQLPS